MFLVWRIVKFFVCHKIHKEYYIFGLWQFTFLIKSNKIFMGPDQVSSLCLTLFPVPLPSTRVCRPPATACALALSNLAEGGNPWSHFCPRPHLQCQPCWPGRPLNQLINPDIDQNQANLDQGEVDALGFAVNRQQQLFSIGTSPLARMGRRLQQFGNSPFQM